MIARALVFKSQSGERLASGMWSLLVWVLYDPDGSTEHAESVQVVVEIDPTQPATWRPAMAAAVVAKGVELGLQVTSIAGPTFS